MSASAVTISPAGHPDQAGEIVEKVLRRAEVAKMARLLQNRLALANFKTKHGWEKLTLDTIEPKVDKELKRKRRNSNGETLSDSSSISVPCYSFSSGITASSPLTAPMFSDDIRGSISGSDFQRRGLKRTATYTDFVTDQTARKRHRSESNAASNFQATRSSWKSTHRLPESSPIYHRQRSRYPASQEPNLSFVSEVSTLPDNSPTFSDDDEQGLPVHSFQSGSARITSSPPRTPPPSRARSARARHASGIGPAETGDEGPNLLLYLATSPSPANPGMKARVISPSTPPSRQAALPSSMMTTPGGGAFMNGMMGPMTPSQAFNISDFINITPSPAQGIWCGRTPATAKTPVAAREARRKLNFDALAPPTGSPNLNRGGARRDTGLGMELGGELGS
ncbi:MAG: hypothetical protein M1819_003093 [Sarea resinae]|nr:MAG: hypothetical protein M1819_003093 [Sarea resinae]